MNSIPGREDIRIAAQLLWGDAVQVSLLKRVTDDGMTDLDPSVPIGKRYIVFPGSTKPIQYGRTDTEKVVTRSSIFALDEEGDRPGWLPVELLDMEHAVPIKL